MHVITTWSFFNYIFFLICQFKYGKISSKHNGSVKKGVIFATYSSLIGESQSGGKYKTRFQQLLHWCGEDFDGVVSLLNQVIDYYHQHKSMHFCKCSLIVLFCIRISWISLTDVLRLSMTSVTKPKMFVRLDRPNRRRRASPFRSCRTNSPKLASCTPVPQVCLRGVLDIHCILLMQGRLVGWGGWLPGSVFELPMSVAYL